MQLFFHTGRRDAADYLIQRYHYTRRPIYGGLVALCATWHLEGGLFGDCGEPVAAAVITYITAPQWGDGVHELSRLVRADNFREPLTKFLSLLCRAAREEGMDLLISYADAAQGHHGGIYQAASWNFSGRRAPKRDGLFFAGRFISWRSAVAKWGSQDPEKLRKILGREDIEPSYDVGKYLYWRALTRAGEKRAKELGLLSLPYPKPKGRKNDVHSCLAVGCTGCDQCYDSPIMAGIPRWTAGRQLPRHARHYPLLESRTTSTTSCTA